MAFNLNDYVPVHERLQLYRKDYPKGMIDHEIIELTEDRVVIKVRVYDEEQHLLADGLACEEKIDGFINKHSMVENCSTSALGRALAFIGYKITRGMASQEEMRKVQRYDQQR